MSGGNKSIIPTHVRLVQGSDCCGPSEDMLQYLDIDIFDGGGGAYAVLKTDRWAIDIADLKDLCSKLKKLCVAHDKFMEELDNQQK